MMAKGITTERFCNSRFPKGVAWGAFGIFDKCG